MNERCGHCGNLMAAGDTDWIGERLGARPLSINKLQKLYPPAAEDRLRLVRHEWCGIGSRSKRTCWVNHGRPVEIVVTPLHADYDSPQDAGNCYPDASAALEGLRCAGVLADTSSDHVSCMTFLAPELAERDGLRIQILCSSKLTNAAQQLLPDFSTVEVDKLVERESLS